MKTPIIAAVGHEVPRDECRHEETHRGGAIWTICDQCGRRWADDEAVHEVPPPAGIDREALAAELERLSEAATPGPWRVSGAERPGVVVRFGDIPVAEIWLNGHDHIATGSLIVALVNAFRRGDLIVAPPAPAIPRQDEAELRAAPEEYASTGGGNSLGARMADDLRTLLAQCAVKDARIAELYRRAWAAEAKVAELERTVSFVEQAERDLQRAYDDLDVAHRAAEAKVAVVTAERAEANRIISERTHIIARLREPTDEMVERAMATFRNYDGFARDSMRAALFAALNPETPR